MAPDLDERIETYYVRVRGIVQGVGFRHATVRQAHALGIKRMGRESRRRLGRSHVAGRGESGRPDASNGCGTGRRHARVTELAGEERLTEKRYERFEQH